MGKISEIKMQLRHKEWAEMVSECQASGKKVDEWCSENGINVSTYYKRLNVLRIELIEGSEKQSIVPVSVSASVSVPQNNAVSDTGKEHISDSGKIIIRKDGFEVELSGDTSEDMLMALLYYCKEEFSFQLYREGCSRKRGGYDNYRDS